MTLAFTAVVALAMALTVALTVHLLTGPGFRGAGREVRAAAAVVLGMLIAVFMSDVAAAATVTMTLAFTAVVALAMALTVHLLTGPGFRGAGREVRAAAVVVLGMLIAVFMSDVAAAATADEETLSEVRLSVITVTLIVSVFIPIVTGIATKLNTSATVKGVVTLVLNLVNSAVVGQIVADGTAVFSQETLVGALIGMAISVASYLGFYKPVDINAKLSPDKGI